MAEPKPVLKFIVSDGEKKGSYVDIDVTEYSWPQGGKGVCPFCGAEVDGVKKEWICTNEECGGKFEGPIF